MARCGCGGGSGGGCNCSVTGIGLIAVTGAGSAANPYVVAFTGAIGGDTAVEVTDSASVNFTLTGDGSLGDPYDITAVVIDGVVVPATEATQDIIGGALGDGLAYDDVGNLISAVISTDPGNVLVFGADGGLFSAGADLGTFMTLGTAQDVTAQKTWNLPTDDISAIRINTQTVVTTGVSEDSFAIYWGGATRTGWFNEWGGLRVFTPNPATLGYSDQAVKLFSRQDVDTLQIIRANTSTLGFRLRDVGLSLVQQYGGYGPWQTFTTFTNGFSTYTDPVEYEPRARLAAGGDYVELRGRINTDLTPAQGNTVCILPAGLWPLRTVHLDCTARSPQTLVRLDISTAGVITVQTGGTYTYLSLDGLSFYIGVN